MKLATVVFADLADSTAWGEDRAPDEVREHLVECLRDLAAEVAAHGGTVDKYTGDGIMADFGVPTSRADDAVRAVRCALGMQRRAAAWSAAGKNPLRLRVGVNSGEVSTGGPFGTEVLVFGTTVNVASRLQNIAALGQVVVSDRTARLVAREFELENVGAFDLKGVTGSVTAYEVVGERSDTVAASRFVGREPELRELEARWQAWGRARRSDLMVLAGDAGVGKSRLVDEFVRRIAPVSVHAAACVPDMKLAPAWPLRSLLCEAAACEPHAGDAERRDAVTTLARRWSLDIDAIEGVATILGVLAGGIDADPRRAQSAVASGWAAAAQSLAAELSVVVIEDLHWADATTLEILSASVGGPGPFILATARPEFDVAEAPNADLLTIGPLARDDAAALVRTLAPGLDEEAVAVITSRTDGNPFFVEEAVARVTDGARALASDVPDSVKAVLHARLDQLSPAAHAALQAAAVIGRSGDRGALGALVDDGAELPKALSELERFALLSITPVGAFAFRHELVRDVAYERTPRRSRGLLHRRLAEHLTTTEPAQPESLAHHWLAAWEQTGDDALRRTAGAACLDSARHAYRLHALIAGRALASRAIELLAGTAPAIEALEVAGDLAAISSDGDAAWSLYAEAAELAAGRNDHPALARLAAKAAIRATRWAGTMFNPPGVDDVQALIDRGVAAAGHGDSPPLAQLLSARAFLVGMIVGDLSNEARRFAEDAVAMAERLDDPLQLSAALDALNVWCTGRLGDAYRLIARRVDLVPRLDIAEAGDVFAMAAWTTAVMGRHAEATAFASECVRLATSADPSTLISGLSWRVVARCGLGDWDGAIRDLADVEEVVAELGHAIPPPSTAMAFGARALIAAARGDTAEVERLAEVVGRSRKARPESLGRGRDVFLGRAFTLLGQHERAAELIVDDDGDFAALNVHAECELVEATQQWQRVPDLLARARRLVEASELEALDAAAHHLEGVAALAAGELEAGMTALRRAVARWQLLPAPWDEATALRALANAEREAGSLAAARDHATRATTLLRRLGVPAAT